MTVSDLAVVEVANEVSHTSTTTSLTPNTRCVATPSGDINETIQLVFYEGQIPWWSPSVSSANLTIELDATSGPYQAGFLVKAIPQAGTFTLVCTGDIVDGDQTYKLDNKFLGSISVIASV